MPGSLRKLYIRFIKELQCFFNILAESKIVYWIRLMPSFNV